MWLLAALLVFAVAVPGDAWAQARPSIPSSAMPGRERERFIDQPFPPLPRIELQDGRPKPVIQQQTRTKPKRKRPAR